MGRLLIKRLARGGTLASSIFYRQGVKDAAKQKVKDTEPVRSMAGRVISACRPVLAWSHACHRFHRKRVCSWLCGDVHEVESVLYRSHHDPPSVFQSFPSYY